MNHGTVRELLSRDVYWKDMQQPVLVVEITEDHWKTKLDKPKLVRVEVINRVVSISASIREEI